MAMLRDMLHIRAHVQKGENGVSRVCSRVEVWRRGVMSVDLPLCLCMMEPVYNEDGWLACC